METEKTMIMKNQGRLRVWILLLSDLVALYGILAVVLFCYQCAGADYSLTVLKDLWPLPLAVMMCNQISRLYGGSFFYPGAGCAPVEELKRLTMSVLGGYVLLFAYLSLSRSSESYTRLGLLLSMLISILLLPIIRYWVRCLLKRCHIGQIPVLVAGAEQTARIVGQELKRDRFFGFKVAGYLDDDPAKRNAELPDGKVLGTVSEAAEIAGKLGVDYFISTLPVEATERHLDSWLKYFRSILIIPASKVSPILWTHLLDLHGLGALEIGNRLQRPLLRYGKCCCEFVIAVLAIICLFPVCLLLALLVKCTSRGPIFYRAKRLGLHGKNIEIWKFRTMYADADQKLEKMLAENPELAREWKENFKLKEDPRITPLGKFLRKTSLDELPQFLNVLRGEMAVIGPRPIVQKEVAYYGKHYEVFSRVKPGITGLWQVSGRSDTTYERRIALDMYYVNNWSIWLDYYIFLKTVKEVLICRGAK